MIRKIKELEDVKVELYRYFETLAALPYPKRPELAKNRLYYFAVTQPNDDEIVESESKFTPTQVDIADFWYIDANWIPILTRLEYDILSALLKDKPLPWKLIERKHNKTRQMLRLYAHNGLLRILSTVRD